MTDAIRILFGSATADRTAPCGLGRYAVLALAALGVACADPEPTPSASHPVVSWDANDLEQWSLAANADFLLGEEEIGFLHGAPAGLISASGLAVVADRGNNRILVLDSLGRLHRTVGRRGKGPLEFVNLMLLSQWPGDSVFAFDSRTRYSVFSPETGEGRTVQFDGMMGPVGGWPGPEPDEVWLFEGGHLYPGGQYDAGRQRVPYSVVRWRAPDSLVRVMSVAGQDYTFGPGGRGYSRPPVFFRTSAAAGNGLFFVSEGDPRLTVFDGTGAIQLEVRVAGTGVELVGEVRSRVTDSLYALEARTAIRMERRLESSPLPERTDGFDHTVLARDGTLWMGGRSIAGIEHRLWVNLEQDGAPVRRLRLPRSVSVLDVDEDRLLLSRRDDLGTYQVEMRRLVPQT